MTGRYVNRDRTPLRELSDKIEQRVATAMAGFNHTDSVNDSTADTAQR